MEERERTTAKPVFLCRHSSMQACTIFSRLFGTNKFSGFYSEQLYWTLLMYSFACLRYTVLVGSERHTQKTIARRQSREQAHALPSASLHFRNSPSSPSCSSRDSYPRQPSSPLYHCRFLYVAVILCKWSYILYALSTWLLSLTTILLMLNLYCVIYR